MLYVNYGGLVQSLSHVQLWGPCGLQPARLLCPWNFPDKNTGVGSLALLQGNFPNQNPCLLHFRQPPALQVDSLLLSHQGSLQFKKVTPLSLMNTLRQSSTKYQQAKFNSTIERLYTMTKWDLLLEHKDASALTEGQMIFSKGAN